MTHPRQHRRLGAPEPRHDRDGTSFADLLGLVLSVGTLTAVLYAILVS